MIHSKEMFSKPPCGLLLRDHCPLSLTRFPRAIDAQNAAVQNPQSASSGKFQAPVVLDRSDQLFVFPWWQQLCCQTLGTDAAGLQKLTR